MARFDPRRLGGDDLTLNEILFDRHVRHALFLEGLKTRQVLAILEFLDEKVYPRIVGELSGRLENIATRGFDTGPMVTGRLRQLRDAIDRIVEAGYQVAGQRLREDLFEAAAMESTFQTELLRRQLGPFEVEWEAPSSANLRSAVRSRPFQGRVLRTWWRGVTTSSRQLIRDRVSIGVTAGETTQQIVRGIRGDFAQGRLPSRTFGAGTLARVRANVEAVVRTAVNHTVTMARHVGYEANEDILEGWQFVAVLDGRTTDICATLDGKIFPIGEGPLPPRHFGCRSADAPVVKTDGLNLPPEERASIGGPVKGTFTWPAWLKLQPARVQNIALGRRRAELFRRGEISVQRFQADLVRTLTPRQVLELERGIAGFDKAIASILGQ